MTLENTEKLGRILMKEYNLKEWTFKFDNALVRFGCCKYIKKLISLSKELVHIPNTNIL